MENRKYGRLAVGSVHPDGRLERWRKMTALWSLKYAYNRDVGVYAKFWNRNETAEVVFDENDQTLTLCDYTAYFANGLVRHAVMAPGSEEEKEWLGWLEQLYASVDEDGYLGAFVPEARWQHWLEIFSQTLTHWALLYWYEAKGDKRAFDVAKRAMDLMMEAWYGNDARLVRTIFAGHGTIVVLTADRFFELTGDERYRKFAVDVFERYGKTKAYLRETGDDAFLTSNDPVTHQHNAVETEHVGFPTAMYMLTGNRRYLQAGIEAYNLLHQHLCVDGQPHGGEMMTHVGARITCEHCSAVEFFWVAHNLACATGEVRYMDEAERDMLNAYPSAKTADGTMLTYAHTPNQLAATEWCVPHNNTIDADWWASRQFFSSAHEPLCCNVNSPRGVPAYIDAMVNRSRRGLAVFYYGPATVNTEVDGNPVSLEMRTDYPYEDEINITVRTQKAAKWELALRVPCWSNGATVTVNGESITFESGKMASLEREWHDGDTVRIVLDNPVYVIKGRVSEFGVRAATCVVYKGALLYTLPVKEEWQRYTAPAHGPGQDIISCRIVAADDAEWNYALVFEESTLQTDFTAVKLETGENALPFGESPIGLRVKAKKVLNWYREGDPEHIMTPGAPFLPMKLDDKLDEITLIPYGHTQLRMTYLPFIEK